MSWEFEHDCKAEGHMPRHNPYPFPLATAERYGNVVCTMCDQVLDYGVRPGDTLVESDR